MSGIKISTRTRKKLRVRRRIFGSAVRPRLSVTKSGNYTFAQIICDETGRSLCAISSKMVPASKNEEGKPNSKKSCNVAKELGKLLAEKAKSLNVSRVVFDRNGYPYHGRIAAVAEGAREGGLEF